jgi:hypothetical protein
MVDVHAVLCPHPAQADLQKSARIERDATRGDGICLSGVCSLAKRAVNQPKPPPRRRVSTSITNSQGSNAGAKLTLPSAVPGIASCSLHQTPSIGVIALNGLIFDGYGRSVRLAKIAATVDRRQEQCVPRAQPAESHRI